ncbi:MAG: type IV pilin-like G/H family protein [Dolichospermum sp.]
MKTELKAKFLQHLLGKKKENEGFTLIELLVVIIIIGILSAIALPSFINQAAKAKQTEAKTTISAFNRAQQTRRIEQGSFSSDITSLSIGLNATATANYSYTMAGGGTNANVTIVAMATDVTTLRGYSGGVFISAPTGDAPSIICQTTGVQGSTFTASGLAPGSATQCPTNMEILK